MTSRRQADGDDRRKLCEGLLSERQRINQDGITTFRGDGVGAGLGVDAVVPDMPAPDPRHHFLGRFRRRPGLTHRRLPRLPRLCRVRRQPLRLCYRRFLGHDSDVPRPSIPQAAVPAMNEDDDRLGGTITIGGDLTVRRLGFGAMRLCGPGVWGEPDDPAAARAVLKRAVELGITLIDTADAYGPEVNERLIAEALHPYSDGVVIATKGGLTRPGAGRWTPNGRPEHLRAACDGSLRRLKLERIDLYQLHSPDPRVPFEESVGALADLQVAGKVRHVGLSNVSVDQLRRARRIVPVVSVQNRFNLADRSSDAVVAACDKEGIAFLPWYPLNAGGSAAGTGALGRVALRHGATPTQVAIAWLLARAPVVVPIPGTSSIAHLEENVAAARLRLSPEDRRTLA